MAVKLVFLGRLSDIAGGPDREVQSPLDWRGLLDVLNDSVRDWAAGEKVKLAVNGVILADKTLLAAKDGDEVALLPPVSGG